MRTQYLLIGLKQQRVVTSASLSSSGVKTEEEYLVMGDYLDQFDTYD